MKKTLTLWEAFLTAPDDMKWRLYDAANHNKLITSDYGALSYEDISEDFDSKLVVSIKIRSDYVGVYVK